MEYNHTKKIVETYQKLHELAGFKEQNKQLLDIVLDTYSYAYEASEHEERQRVHFFYPEMIDKELLLKQCSGEVPLDEDTDDDDEEEFWEMDKAMLKVYENDFGKKDR